MKITLILLNLFIFSLQEIDITFTNHKPNNGCHLTLSIDLPEYKKHVENENGEYY